MKLMTLQWSFMKSILLSTKVRASWNLDWLTQIDSKHNAASIDSSNKAEMKDGCLSSLTVLFTSDVHGSSTKGNKPQGKVRVSTHSSSLPSSPSVQPQGSWSSHSFSQGLFSPCPCLPLPCLCSPVFASIFPSLSKNLPFESLWSCSSHTLLSSCL